MSEMSDELIHYIIKYYSGLFTELESKAHRHLMSIEKISPISENDSKLAIYKKKEWISTDSEVLNLIKDGEEAFYKATAARILDESLKEITINKCPNCGKLARTPRAKQCRHCGHKWFTINK